MIHWLLAVVVTVSAAESIGPARSAQLAGSYAVDHERSTLVAKLKKGGLLRFLGHEHGVVPDSWSAEVFFDADDLERSRIVVEIDAASLLIDTPEARALAGVDPDGPSAEEIEEIRAKMLSDEQLDVAAFAAIRFVTNRISLIEDGLRLTGELALHGVRRAVAVDARLRLEDGFWVLRGGFEIKQRDFGIEPISIGGVVKVADEVEILFEIHAPTGR